MEEYSIATWSDLDDDYIYLDGELVNDLETYPSNDVQSETVADDVFQQAVLQHYAFVETTIWCLIFGVVFYFLYKFLRIFF